MALVLGREFFKMTGSGNDFVFVLATSEPAGELERPEVIRRLCARGTGIGADGIVYLEPAQEPTLGGRFRMRYLNSDGSVAAMCGNAALCATRLAVDLGIAPADGFAFETESGVVDARMRDGLPEIDLAPVTEVRTDAGIPTAAGERQIGFALVGVPHLVVRCDDLARVPVVERGRALRHDVSLAHGANVNFIAPTGDGLAIRTYERGVESETLACGTGTVAAGILAEAWGIVSGAIRLETRSGKRVSVTPNCVRPGLWQPSLRGEGRLVFAGRLGESGEATS